ncbi:MAG TPA: ABC transporter permease [Candidatus Krumholzibacteriaceae bacterium]|jgi:ABC-2 type transport system permease protein|nr:ABC transporter permease [Candidatus Krumholzibacteriaceae bacterium]
MVSVKRIISDLRLFGRGYLRNSAGLFFGLIFPVILIVIFGAIFSSGFSGTITVYVQNHDTGPVSNFFLGNLTKTGTVSLVLVSNSENFSQYLSAHSASDGIIIPANFSADYSAGKHVDVILYSNPSQSSSAIVSGALTGVINGFNLVYFHGTPIIGVTQTTANSQVTKYIDFLVPGLVGFSILVSPMFSLVNISSEYKRIKLFKQLSLTPLTKIEWLTSKVLFYILLSTASFLLMVVVGVFAFGAHIVLSVWLIPFLILGPMLFASLGMLVGTVSRNTETAAVVGNIITFPMMFLAGTFFPISLMPAYLQNFARFLPLFYIIDGLNAVMVYSNYAQAATDLVVVAVIAIVFFVAAVRLFKWRED